MTVAGVTLVTGGAGFVGKALVRTLIDRGARVRVLDLGADAAPGASQPEVICGSITDVDAVRAALSGVDTVYHLAGVADLWRADRAIFERVNVDGTRIVLEAARAAGIRRFVQCSSLTTLVARSAPIGPSTADETVALAPDALIGDYPQAKRKADLMVEAAARDGFNASIAMPTEPLGAGDDNLTPPTRMIIDFLNGATPAYIDCTLNFVPVGSLAEGLAATAEHGAPGARYLLGGENIAMARLLSMLEEIAGRTMPKTKLPYAVALMAGIVDTKIIARLTGRAPKAPLTGVRLAGRRVSFSSDKAARDLGWRAAPVAPALQAMIDWARREGHVTPR